MENKAKEYRLSFSEKAAELVFGMTLNEKILLMAANDSIKDYIKGFLNNARYNERPYAAGGCERLGVPALHFCDGPRGVVSGRSTCFPAAMARGASFDRELMTRVGVAVGEEVRANGGNFYAGVCLNLPYNPGDGRSQETYGEDSCHVGEMGAAFLKGVQSCNVAACIKHFAFNSMEKARFKVNVLADKRTEREVYLPHFKRCIDEGAASLMTSYNKYFGEFCGHSNYLIRDVVKGEWEFDGPVMSDFLLGVRNTAKGISGGLDIEMRIRRVYSLARVKRALRRGAISIEQINDSALRIVRMLLAYTDAPEREYPASLIASREHILLARECAEKSITLLKNNGILPLREVRSIALVGNLANLENTGDHGSSNVAPPYVTTLLGALEKEYPHVKCTWYPSGEYSSRLSEIASADAAVIVCGCDCCDEGEYIPTNRGAKGGDRVDLGLKKSETEMIKKVGASQRNTIAVLIGGNVIITHDWQDSVGAILFAYYPGMEGGSALADILFGKVNPSGKLPFAIAPAQSCYPRVDWNARRIKYGYYHGYRKLEKEGVTPDYPFGFGLSYTKFELGEAVLECADEQEAVFSLLVKNIGDLAGGETAQLYIGWKESRVDRPIKTLVDFTKVYLAPGEERAVTLRARKSALAYFDETRNEFVQEDIVYLAFIGNSSSNEQLQRIEFSFNSLSMTV